MLLIDKSFIRLSDLINFMVISDSQPLISLSPCPDLVPWFGAWHRHQCEHSILVVPIQKLEHGTRVRALSPKVVFRHRTRARALVCTRFHQCHAFYPCFPVIWSCGGDKMARPQQIEMKLRALWCLNNVPFSARAQCPGTGTKSGWGLTYL